MEKLPPRRELEPVTLSPVVFTAFQKYIDKQEAVSPEALVQASIEVGTPDSNLALRKPDGSALTPAEALAIIEAQQAAGRVSLENDDEGFFSVVQQARLQNTGEVEPSPLSVAEQMIAGERRKAVAKKAGWLARHGASTKRMAVENKDYFSSMGRSASGQIEHVTRNIIQREEPKRVQAEEDAARKKQNEIDVWQTNNRQTSLTLEYSQEELAKAQEVRQDAYDPRIKTELEYLNKTIENERKRLIKEKTTAGHTAVTRSELLRIETEVPDRIIREFLGSDASDENIEKYKVMVVRARSGTSRV